MKIKLGLRWSLEVHHRRGEIEVFLFVDVVVCVDIFSSCWLRSGSIFYYF